VTSTSTSTSGITSTAGPRIFKGWRRERYGWFAGLTGGQLIAVCVAGLPLLLAVGQGRWAAAGVLLPVVAAVIILVAVPVRGRPAARWLLDATAFGWARWAGWSWWRSAAATGAATAQELKELDLPGVLAGLAVHDGPPMGPGMVRVCVVHDSVARRWSATARCAHPGLGTADEATRAAFADGLGALLRTQAGTDDTSWVSLLVRTVPDDGAERAAWLADHTIDDPPPAAARAGAAIEAAIRAGGMRHELFVTVAVAESPRLRRAAHEAGGGAAGRARILYRHLADIEQRLRGLGCTQVTWLNTETLAEAIRTGYHPADTAILEAARQQARRGHPTVTGVPPGAAGPAHALPAARVYTHDAYTTVAYAVLLPELGTTVGALARLLTPSVAGERRCVALHYQPLPAARAAKLVERDVWVADTAREVKVRKGFRVSRAERRRSAETASHEQQITAGHTLVRVAGAAAVTVPAGWDVEDHAAGFEAAARAGRYRLVRLDLAQDTGFVAAVLPLGIGLPDRSHR
jgi:hypothetical protein